jgi:hypothetical protein
MSNPVAIRYDFDGYGYKYMDSGSGSDWQTRVEGEPLYAHPAKTLTDEEIEELADTHLIVETEYIGMGDYVAVSKGEIEFARAILKKASEK